MYDMRKLYAVIFLLFFILLPFFSFAEVPTAIPYADSWQVLVRVLKFLWPIFIGIAIVMYLVAGFLFITSGGDPGKTKMAKDSFIWASVGVAVGILAFSLPFIIGTTIGL